MKRLLLSLGVILIVLLIAAVIVARFFMGALVKKGVETAGPAITKVDVKLDNASLALLSGSGHMGGLVVGNPQGFKTPSAMRFESIDIQVVPRSIFADKVVVRSMAIKAPEVTFEGGLQGNNLSKLLENIRSSGGKSTTTNQTGRGAASRKIQLDDLVISGGKLNLQLNVLGTQSATVPLPEIHLANLGQGPDGITAAELSEQLVRKILESATQIATKQISSLGKGLGGAAQNLSTGAVEQLKGVTKGVGDLFKRK